MRKKGIKIQSVIWAVLTLAVMVAIFIFSSQNGEESTSVSSSVTEVVEKVCETVIPATKGHITSSLVRKMAHVFMYLLLGTTSTFFVRSLSLHTVFNWVIPFGFCFLYACSDELHQLFIGGRAGMFTDVLIDSIGFVFAIVVINLSAMLINGIRKKKQKEEK